MTIYHVYDIETGELERVQAEDPKSALTEAFGTHESEIETTENNRFMVMADNNVSKFDVIY